MYINQQLFSKKYGHLTMQTVQTKQYKILEKSQTQKPCNL